MDNGTTDSTPQTAPDHSQMTKGEMVAALQGVALEFQASLTLMQEDGYAWLEFYDSGNGVDDFGGMDCYQELALKIKDATGRDFYFNKARVGEVCGALDADIVDTEDQDIPPTYTVDQGDECCISDLGIVITEVKTGRRPPRR